MVNIFRHLSGLEEWNGKPSMYVESEDLVKKDDRGSEGKRVIKTKQKSLSEFFQWIFSISSNAILEAVTRYEDRGR